MVAVIIDTRISKSPILKKTALVCSIVFCLALVLNSFRQGKMNKPFIIIIACISFFCMQASLNAIGGLDPSKNYFNTFNTGQKYVDLNGEEVLIKHSKVKELESTFDEHDFSILTFDSRLLIYENTKKPIIFPLFVSTFIGGGAGSLIQNNLPFFSLSFIIDIVGVSVFAAGALSLAVLLPSIIFVVLMENPDQFLKVMNISLIAVGVGAGFLAINRIAQIISVIAYGNAYNKALRKGLGLEKDLSDAFAVENIAFYPIIQPEISQTFGFSQIKAQYGIGCKIQI